jgi:AcrR family transcriptional regulator
MVKAVPENPRVQRSRDRVLTTAFALLAESGLAGFSVDEVARRSGVAKTTIYRHWPTREALALDAAAGTNKALSVPDTGTLADDCAAILGELGRLLQTEAWARIVPSLVDVGERDGAFAEVHGSVQRGHAEPLRVAIARARERGEYAGDDDALVSLLVGPLYYRRWFSREPITPAFVATVVRAALA